MQKLLGATIGLTTSLCFFLNSINVLAAPPARWVRIATLRVEQNGLQGVYFVDSTSIKVVRSFRYYWLSLVYTKPLRVSNQGKNFLVSKLVAYVSIDCNNKSDYQVHRMSAFDNNNRRIITLDFNNESVVIPAQGTKLSGNYVCSRR
ncbi:MAG TPA: surface-adhesin E family protein [Chroococcales cyanobacterium]|jgi:hypothetical protein